MHFTPTQVRILQVLSDGKKHDKKELRECLGDDLTSDKTLSVHLCFLRKKLQAIGEDITTELTYKKWAYRHVRLLYRGE